MKSAALPIDLEPGELLLQWVVPSRASRLRIALRRARRASVLLAVTTVFFGTFTTLCAGALHPVLAVVTGVGMGMGVLAALTLPYAYQLLMKKPVRWWVTSRRLITDGGAPRPLRGLTDIAVQPPHDVELHVGEDTEHIGPVDALPELWGALLMGRALSGVSFPEVLADEPTPTVPSTVCLDGEARNGGTRTPGALILRRDRVAWIPGTPTSRARAAGELAANLAGAAIGYRIRTVRPNPPLVPLIHRIMRMADPNHFDEVLDAITATWGGFVVHGSTTLSVEEARRGTSLVLTVGDTTIRATGVDDHPNWDEVQVSLGLTPVSSAA